HPRGFLLAHPARLAVFHKNTTGNGRYSRHEEHLRREHRAFQETSGSILRTADTDPEQWHPRRPYAVFPEETETMTRYIPSSFRLPCILEPPLRKDGSIVADTCRANPEDMQPPNREQMASEQPERKALRPGAKEKQLHGRAPDICEPAPSWD